MEKKSKATNGSRHSDILVGVALLLLAAVFAYLGFSQPKISNNYIISSQEELTEQSPVFTENTESADAGASYTQSALAAGDNKGSESSVSFPLDLNTCTAAQLMQIDGIGEVRASAIIAYRNELGGYTSVEQLKNIKGIGEATFAKIAPYVTV